MIRSLDISVALVAVAVSAVALSAAEYEAFRGTAARSGTHKRPLLIVDGQRYELKASDKADTSVAELLAKFSDGNTGTYVVQGTRVTANGNDGILVVSIALATATTPTETSGVAAVSSNVVTVANCKCTVYEYTDPDSKTYCVVIPAGLKTVRGLFVNSNYYAGDSRNDWTLCHYYREFMHLHDFALVAANGTCPHAAALNGFRKSLREVSIASRHPELVNAPYVAVGFSAGGGFASTLMTHDPNKTIAVGIYGARYNFDVFTRPGGPAGPFAAHLGIPSALITGEREKLNDPAVDGRHKVDEVFVPNRPKGAQLAWLERQGIGHEYDENRQDVVVMPLLDLAVRTRYPKDGDVTKGPVELGSIDSATGWVADNTTWKSGLTKICPSTEFKGDLGHSSWLQNEDIAHIYRAYATYDNPLTITSPKPCGPGTPALDPGADVPLVVDASRFPDWQKLEFFDGAKKLGTLTGAPAQFTATHLTPGYHVFSVLGTDSQGIVRSSNPVMVVVRAPANTVQ